MCLDLYSGLSRSIYEAKERRDIDGSTTIEYTPDITAAVTLTQFQLAADFLDSWARVHTATS